VNAVHAASLRREGSMDIRVDRYGAADGICNPHRSSIRLANHFISRCHTIWP